MQSRRASTGRRPGTFHPDWVAAPARAPAGREFGVIWRPRGGRFARRRRGKARLRTVRQRARPADAGASCLEQESRPTRMANGRAASHSYAAEIIGTWTDPREREVNKL